MKKSKTTVFKKRWSGFNQKLGKKISWLLIQFHDLKIDRKSEPLTGENRVKYPTG